MRLLLTGAGGMLGSSIFSRVAGSYDLLAPKRSDLNLLNPIDVREYFEKWNPDLVIHTAARVGGIQANINSGFDFLLENLKMDSNVFDAARNSRVKDLIYIASTCMYPKDRNSALKESDLLSGALEPTNEGYALSKIIGAKTVEIAAHQENLAWRTLILSNLYGPRDHFEPSRSHLIAAIIRKVDDAIEKSCPTISMWGTGQSRREFTFVEDVSNFISENLEYVSEWPFMMNLGSGVDHTVLEYYEMITKIMGYKGRVVSDPSKPEGMKRKLSDSSLSNKFGWNPRTSLSEGLEQTIAWYRKNKVEYTL
jgi:GDP-L-fucose synthase